MEGSVSSCMTEQFVIVTTLATPELCVEHQDTGDHVISGPRQGEIIENCFYCCTTIILHLSTSSALHTCK